MTLLTQVEGCEDHWWVSQNHKRGTQNIHFLQRQRQGQFGNNIWDVGDSQCDRVLLVR